MARRKSGRIEVVRDEAENLGEQWIAEQAPLLPKPRVEAMDRIDAPFRTPSGEPSFYPVGTWERPTKVNSRLRVPLPDGAQRPVILKSLVYGVWIYCENEKQAAEEARRHGKVIFHGPGSQYFPLERQAAQARREA